MTIVARNLSPAKENKLHITTTKDATENLGVSREPGVWSLSSEHKNEKMKK